MTKIALKKYKTIWNKISNLLKKGFDSKQVYNGKKIKNKTNIYNNKINTNFPDNKVLGDNECCTYLSVTLLHSVVKINKDYYPQIFLEKCKYAIKKKKIMNLINEGLNLDEPSDETDDDNSNESDGN